MLNNPIIFIDPSGHHPQKYLFYDADVGTNLLPPIPRVGLNEGGKRTITNMLLFASKYNVMFDSRKFLGAILYAEAGSNWVESQEVVKEAYARKYNSFCQAGPWTPDCINKFWAYWQPARTAGSSEKVGTLLFGFLSQTLRGVSKDYLDIFVDFGRSVADFTTTYGRAGQRNDRPSGWINMCLSESDKKYFAHTYKVESPEYPNLYFVVTTANEVFNFTGSYVTSMVYRGCKE